MRQSEHLDVIPRFRQSTKPISDLEIRNSVQVVRNDLEFLLAQQVKSTQRVLPA